MIQQCHLDQVHTAMKVNQLQIKILQQQKQELARELELLMKEILKNNQGQECIIKNNKDKEVILFKEKIKEMIQRFHQAQVPMVNQ